MFVDDEKRANKEIERNKRERAMEIETRKAKHGESKRGGRTAIERMKKRKKMMSKQNGEKDEDGKCREESTLQFAIIKFSVCI